MPLYGHLSERQLAIYYGFIMANADETPTEDITWNEVGDVTHCYIMVSRSQPLLYIANKLLEIEELPYIT